MQMLAISESTKELRLLVWILASNGCKTRREPARRRRSQGRSQKVCGIMHTAGMLALCRAAAT